MYEENYSDYYQKFKNKKWTKLPSILKQLLCYAHLFTYIIKKLLSLKKIILLFTITGSISIPIISSRVQYPLQIKNSDASVRQLQQIGTNNTVNISAASPAPDEIEEKLTSGWVPFDSQHWNGIISRFKNVNGVFSPLDPKMNIDAVAYLKRSVVDGIDSTLVFQIVSSHYANLNIYFDNWFRWEIAGNDLRSVKLYKNKDGCSAMKQVELVSTQNQYIPNKGSLPLMRDINANFYVKETEKGKIETGINLEYYDDLGKKINLNGFFFYEFNVDLHCDETTVLDIKKDFSPIGVGIMPSLAKTGSNEQPEIKLLKFKLK